jgi:hypothetical protein
MEEEITKFLAGNRLHEDAVRLYLDYGRNRVIRSRLERARSTGWMHEKLCYELGKMVGRNIILEAQGLSSPCNTSRYDFENQITEELSEINGNITPLPAFNDIRDESIDEDLDLIREKSRLHGQRAKLSNSLRSFAMDDDAGRAAVVKQIKEITRQMNAIRKKQKGITDEETDHTEAKAEGGEVTRNTLLNARSNLSKARNRLAKAEIGTPQWSKYRDKIAQLQKVVEEIEQSLK